MCFQGGCGFFVPVGSEIVENDRCAGRDLWDQDFANVGCKGRTVHGTVDDPGCDQRIVHKARDQGLRPPTSKRSIHRQTCTTRSPAA